MDWIRDSEISSSHYWMIGLTIILLTIAILWLMGRSFICHCGYVQIWHSGFGPQSSQHLFDWYTLSHIIRGFITYGIITWIAPGLPLGTRLLIGITAEAGWELFENTDTVIQHYRNQTVSDAYRGDSILNSVSDIVSMIGGFITASKIPWWATVLAAVALEILSLFIIRDSLILNIIMFIYPSDVITTWQTAA